MFVPHVVAITTGSSVAFPNDDLLFHNVFSLSRAGTFDLGRYPQGDTRVRRFDKAGVVKVYCHLHSHMSAIIAVFDHPWFAKVGADGNFEIDRVPPGTYLLTGWHERAGNTDQFRDDRGRRHHARRAAGSDRAMSAAPAAARSPRFVVRVLAASFATVVVVLAAVFTVLMLHTRTLVRRSVVDNLEAGQRLLALFERERQHEAALQATVLTESPPLKAALDTYQSESMLNDVRGGSAGLGDGRTRGDEARRPPAIGRRRRGRRRRPGDCERRPARGGLAAATGRPTRRVGGDVPRSRRW